MAVLSRASPLQSAEEVARDTLATMGLLLRGSKEANPTSSWLHQKAVLPFSVTWTGWKVGQRGT